MLTTEQTYVNLSGRVVRPYIVLISLDMSGLTAFLVFNRFSCRNAVGTGKCDVAASIYLAFGGAVFPFEESISVFSRIITFGSFRLCSDNPKFLVNTEKMGTSCSVEFVRHFRTIFLTDPLFFKLIRG